MSIASEQQRCPKCGGPITAEAPQGLCPMCLLAEVSIPTEAGQTSKSVPPSRDELAAAFPHLEILELIGQGGMGFVFKARQPKLDRFVALKILSQSLAADPAFAERFTREGRVLARLSHPNIVAIHDFGQASGFFYLLMEFVDGVNLRQAMRAGRFTPDQALAIVPKICEALQYAHNEGILHRDIKPENILIDIKGRVKIADFGIAKLIGDVHPETHLTGSGATLGTPHYMAPEQIEKPASVDHRADIYSLGVVFYEMLTGELPLGRFAAPSEKSESDPRLDHVVFRTLEKEPARRPQSAGEMKTQVETIANTSTAVVPRETASLKSPRVALLTFAVLYVVLLWFLAYTAQFMPERVATHFDGYGRPTGWMHRSWALFLAGAMPLFFAGLFWGLGRLTNRLPASLINVPRRDYWLTPERRPMLAALLSRRLVWFACLFVWFFGGLHYLVLEANRIPPPRLSAGGVVVVADVFFVGLLLWVISLVMHLADPEQRRAAAQPQRKRFVYAGVALAVTAVVMAFGFFLRNERRHDEKRLTQEGWEHWQAQRFDFAAANFRAAVEVAPDNANAWNGLGWATFNSGQAEEAENAFQKVIALEPNHPGAQNGLGQIYLSQGKYAEAEEHLIAAAPKAPAAWYGLARLYLIQGKFEEAEKWARDLVDSGQADELVRQMLKAAQARQLNEGLRLRIEPPSAVNRVQASAETWAPSLAPGEKPDPQQILNEAHELAGQLRYEEALQRHLWYHDHALEFRPSHAGVRLSFALSYWMELAGRYPKAKQALVEIRDRGTREFASGGGHFALFMEVSAINRQLGEEDATLALFKSIQSQDPKLARQCYSVMEDFLIEKREYELCASFIPDHQASFENIRVIWERTLEIIDRTPEVKQAALRRQAQQAFVKDTRKLIEILVGVGRKPEAEQIREQAVAVLNVPELQSAVVDAGQRVARFQTAGSAVSGMRSSDSSDSAFLLAVERLTTGGIDRWAPDGTAPSTALQSALQHFQFPKKNQSFPQYVFTFLVKRPPEWTALSFWDGGFGDGSYPLREDAVFETNAALGGVVFRLATSFGGLGPETTTCVIGLPIRPVRDLVEWKGNSFQQHTQEWTFKEPVPELILGGEDTAKRHGTGWRSTVTLDLPDEMHGPWHEYVTATDNHGRDHRSNYSLFVDGDKNVSIWMFALPLTNVVSVRLQGFAERDFRWWTFKDVRLKPSLAPIIP